MPTHKRLAACVILASTLVLMASCQSQNIPQPSSSPTSSPNQSPTSQPVALKPVLAGFLDRNGPPPASFIPVMGGFVVNVYWADIQPAQGAPINSNNAIDQAITTLHQIDPSGRMGLKVRLFAGIHAPEWAKSLGGSPIPIEDPTSGTSGTIGRFWTDDFGAAYNDLEAKLAAKYDSAPEIREITISRCTTVYAEPFIRDASNPVAVAALMSAGFTVDADQRCHHEEVIAHQVWIHTRSDLSFNPYQNLGGGPKTDEGFTEEMMAFCRSTLLARCVLENNSLRSPEQYQYSAMYAAMQQQGPPIAIQTAVLAKVGDLGATIQIAISLGAASVELPAGYQTVPVATLSAGYSALVADASRSAS
jgi:hypothetical protein